MKTIPCLLANIPRQGLDIGIITFLSGGLVDVLTNSNPMKFIDIFRISLNLIVIGPLFYTFITKNICNQKDKRIYRSEVFGLVFIHALLYRFFHEQMHKRFFSIHKYHHTFKENITISTANAVSVPEFIFAYMSPFLMGSCIIIPTCESLAVSAGIVSFFNFLVHCEKLYEHEHWIPYFVTPKLHINHHKRLKPSTMSAPTFHI